MTDANNELSLQYESHTPDIPLLGKKVEEGKRLNSFLIGGITNVPKKRFPYHMEMIHAIRMLLQFRYDVNFSSALLDNESRLIQAPPEKRASVCYHVDQQGVEWSDFLIAELSVASTGTGQELERAYAQGKPVIALIQEQKKKTAGEITYHMETFDGEIEDRKIFVGTSGLSIMVQGNPAVMAVVTYPPDTVWSWTLQKLDNIAWKIQYSRKLDRIGLHKPLKRICAFVHNTLEPRNPRTVALHSLDIALQEVLQLKPLTHMLEEKIKHAGKCDNGEDKLSLIAKKKMLDNLLNFHPLARHHEHKKYEEKFPAQAARLAKPDEDMGKNTAYFKRVITRDFMPKKLEAGRRNGGEDRKLNKL